MPIEAATYISTLNASNPPSGDAVAEGDDHLRLLKSVLLASFPNITGAMTASHSILNGLDARVTAVQSQVTSAVSGASVQSVSGVLEQAQPVIADATTARSFAAGDRGKLITRTNASAMGDALGTAASLTAGWFTEVENISAASILTVTGASNINGSATLKVYPGERYKITSDGTVFRAQRLSLDTPRYLAKTANYTLTPTDVFPAIPLVDFTTAGVTLSTAVAASNFTGGLFVLRNSAASGEVTFDPNSTETINGASTLLVHPNESYLIGVDGANWKILASFTLMASSAIGSKTATYTATTADRGKSIRFAGLAANVTLNLPAAASCGDGFILFVANEDTSDFSVTVDPNSTELIDGFTTRTTFPGSRLMLLCDGVGWRTVGGSWRYFSGNQTITAAGGLTLAHGLGRIPRNVWCELKCTTNDAGYTAGDVLSFSLYNSDGATPFGFSVVPDATNLNVRVSSSNLFYVITKGTGANNHITPANWAVRFYAED